MATDLLYDRSVRVETQSVPGDGAVHTFTAYPVDNQTLLGAFGELEAGGQYLPVAIRPLTGHPTIPDGGGAIFHVEWDDGAGGTGTPATLHMTTIFAKHSVIFP